MYYFDEHLPQKISRAQLAKRGKALLIIKDLDTLSAFFRLSPHQLKFTATYPKYDSFYVRKPTGGKRLIEQPAKPLKRLQGMLADYLQGVYYSRKTKAAYGFIPVPGDEDEPRNIYTNACQHLGQQWVLNLDLKSFFHAITQDQIYQIFINPPFSMTAAAAECLSSLCTLQGRLPMGAPTSPVLSNLVFIDPDEALLSLAAERHWRYTRYADDLTFSGAKKFKEEDLGSIHKILKDKGFEINHDKTRLKDIKSSPEVTGLILRDQPDVSPSFVQGIQADLRLYKLLTSDRVTQRGIFKAKDIRQLMRSIAGQINFLEFIRGEYHPSCIEMNLSFNPDKGKRGHSDEVWKL